MNYHTWIKYEITSGVWRIKHGRSDTSSSGPWLWAVMPSPEFSGTGAEDDADDTAAFWIARQTLDNGFGHRVNP